MSIAQLLAGLLFIATIWQNRNLKKWLSSSLDRSIVIFICVMFVSIVVSNDKIHSLQCFVKWASFILLYFIVYLNADSWESLTRFLKVVFIAALLPSIFGIAEYVLGREYILNIVLHNKLLGVVMEPNSLKQIIKDISTLGLVSSNWFIWGGTGIRAFGTFEDSITFSAYLGLIIPFTVLLNNLSHKYLIPGIIIMAALILTFTRSAYVPLLLILIFFVYHLSKNINMRKVSGVIIVVIAMVGFIVICKPVRETIMMRYHGSINSEFDRKPLWKNGIKIFLARPILGVGLANYHNGLLAFADKDVPLVPAHNNYIQIAAETGVMGLISYLAIIFISVRYSFLVYKKSINKEMKIIALGFIGMWIWYCVQSCFDTYLFGDKFSMMFWLMVGLNGALYRIHLYGKKDVSITA